MIYERLASAATAESIASSASDLASGRVIVARAAALRESDRARSAKLTL